MSEQYVPAVGEIRERYARDCLDHIHVPVRESLEAFDRWLAAHDAEIRRTAAAEARRQALEEAVAAVSDDGYFCPALDALAAETERDETND